MWKVKQWHDAYDKNADDDPADNDETDSNDADNNEADEDDADNNSQSLTLANMHKATCATQRMHHWPIRLVRLSLDFRRNEV